MATNPSTAVTNPPDPLAPKMNGNWRRDILGEVREGTFARKDPESYAKYQEYTKQAEDALYQKYYAEEVSNFGKNASTVNARKDAILDARAAANQRFATEISSAGAGTLVSEQVTQPVLPEQPQPPSSATTPVTPASDPQVPGQSRLVNTADDLFGPVDPATDPQVPSGRPPTLPSGRPIPTPVNPAVNPQVRVPSNTVANVSEDRFAQRDPAGYQQFVEFRDQAAAALREQYTAQELENFGRVDARARQTIATRAQARATTAGYQQFSQQIIAAGAGTVVQSPTPLLPTSPSPPTSPTNTAPVSPAVNPQVPPDGVISEDPLQVRLGGVVITNQADLDTLVRLQNDIFVTQNNLYRNGLIRPRNPAVIAAENELRERLAREEASLERFRNAAIARARTAPPVNPATNPQVPGNYPGTVQNPAQLTPPVVAVDVDVPEPVDPVVNPQVPAAQDFGSDPPIVDPAQAAANQTAAGANNANLQGQIQAQSNQDNAGDWRVKLRLAPNANYLYKAKEPGILQALAVTNGVIFPYTPKISTSYTATYNPYDLTHSNVRGYFYQGSHVGEVKINAIFTAQDTTEANYLLAVIHFFRSVTKMFYGQDQQYRGSPPPLVFLQGLGEYQFSNHPCVVSQFDYTLPDDVDYIRARSVTVSGTNLLQRRARSDNGFGADSTSAGRLDAAGLSAGGLFIPPAPPTLGVDSPTYVPTKMEIAITLLPIQTRAQVSQQFSLEKFGNGNLQKGGFW